MEVLVAAAGGVLAGKKISSILSDIDNKIEQAKSAFTGAGNQLIASGAEQAYESLKQLKSILDEEREKTFEQISDQRKLAIWDLYNVANRLNEKINDDFARAAVQEAKLLPMLQFIGKDVKFLIMRVGPTIITRSDIAQNPIRIFGVGFGVDDARNKYETTVLMNGKPLSKDKIVVKEFGIELALQATDFNIDWNPSAYTYFPMIIQSAVTSQDGLWCGWVSWGCSKTYAATYHLSLYPSNPAALALHQQSEHDELVGDPEILLTGGCNLPNLHNPDHPATTTCPQSGLYSAGDGWRWVSYDRGHNNCSPISGNGCPFAYNEQSNCSFLEDNTKAQCQIQNTGGSVAYQFGIARRRIEKKTDTLPNVPFSLLPGETKRVEFERSAVQVWVDGTLPFGQAFGPYQIKPAGGNGLDIMCTSAGDVGAKSAVNCMAAAPW